MKRSLFKQLIVSALFTCSLSADVPDAREQADNGRRLALRSLGEAGTTDPASLKELRRARDGGRGTDHIWLSAPLTGTAPDPLACVLSSAWPLGGFSIHPMDRACVRLEVPPTVSQETMNAGRLDMDAMILRLKKVFAEEGVPQQWVWVAQVESALNPRAISSAGAAGLFQLMPGTARRFGLQTAPVDDRMEPEKSAGAAAQYLKFLHQEFGCWSLALAAYNAGEGRVKEIMKKRKARTFEEVEHYLPSETRAYVPKVMAVVALREDQLHGVRSAYWMP